MYQSCGVPSRYLFYMSTCYIMSHTLYCSHENWLSRLRNCLHKTNEVFDITSLNNVQLQIYFQVNNLILDRTSSNNIYAYIINRCVVVSCSLNNIKLSGLKLDLLCNRLYIFLLFKTVTIFILTRTFSRITTKRESPLTKTYFCKIGKLQSVLFCKLTFFQYPQ